jgi:gamma-glutamyl:cysteine ligase YbdK (ATP-grasp superfamily)
MCEPTTIIMVAAAVVGAYAAYDAGQTQKEYAKYEAKQAEADAVAEKGDAQVEADRIRKMGKAAVAEANAGIAASGQTLGSAGALAINKEIYRSNEEDAVFALLGGRDRSARLNADAGLARMRGKAASNAGKLGAYSQLAQGGGAAYSGWRTSQTQKTGTRG